MSRGNLIFPKPFCAICGWGLLVLIVSQASALVLHPTGEPPANWTAKPPDSVVGRWSSNASCVAIAPNYIVTIQHAGGGVGSSVFFDGVEYIVATQIIEPTSADLRICRIKQVPPPENPNADNPANLQFYVTPYSRVDETSQGQNIAIGSYGDGRGNTLVKNNKTYGYQWDASANTTQRWGSNNIDGTLNSQAVSIYVTDLLVTDFDGPGEGNSTPYEAAGADHDSGGGWFVLCGGAWRLIGLNAYVQSHQNPSPPPDFLEQTWFRDMGNPNIKAPDLNWGIRISSYAAWIDSTVPPPACVSFVAGDLDGNCVVNELDITLLANQWLRADCNGTNNHCSGADFQFDGNVNLLDYAYLASQWMTSATVMQPCN